MFKPILLAALIASTGCATLVHRPEDNSAQTAAKYVTRVALAVPTIMFSEMLILGVEQNEGLYPHSTPEQSAEFQRRRLEAQLEEALSDYNR